MMREDMMCGYQKASYIRWPSEAMDSREKSGGSKGTRVFVQWISLRWKGAEGRSEGDRAWRVSIRLAWRASKASHLFFNTDGDSRDREVREGLRLEMNVTMAMARVNREERAGKVDWLYYCQ